MTITKIYRQYKVLPNIELHMLRVSAIAQILLENWTGELIDKDAILRTCLLHDIAKPVTFDMSDMDKQRQYVKSQEELGLIMDSYEFLTNNFGTNEHQAISEIGTEIGLNKNTLRLLDNFSWNKVPELLEKKDIESLIPIYCDMRISPQGIVKLSDRIHDLNKRTGKDTSTHLKSGELLEKFIQKRVETDLNEIGHGEVEVIAKELGNCEI